MWPLRQHDAIPRRRAEVPRWAILLICSAVAVGIQTISPPAAHATTMTTAKSGACYATGAKVQTRPQWTSARKKVRTGVFAEYRKPLRQFFRDASVYFGERHAARNQRKGAIVIAKDKCQDWDSDGCSIPRKWQNMLNQLGPENWAKFFFSSCTRHDFGYRNFGKGQQFRLAYDPSAAMRRTVDGQLREDMKAQCAGYAYPTICKRARQIIYAAVRKKGQDAFYGSECYWNDFCLDDTKSKRSLASSTRNLGTRLEFNDKAVYATNRTKKAWRLFLDADYKGDSLCLNPGYTVHLLRTRIKVHRGWFDSKTKTYEISSAAKLSAKWTTERSCPDTYTYRKD